jgi:hypothetical protein
MKNEFNHARLIPNGDGITKDPLVAVEGTGSTITHGLGI